MIWVIVPLRRSRLIVAYAILAVSIPVLLVAYPLVVWQLEDARAASLTSNESLLAPFRGDGVLSESEFQALAMYFIAGFIAYRGPSPSLVRYPGAASYNGARIDQLQGFARFLPVIAMWLASGRPATPTVPGPGPVDLLALARAGVLAGTDPRAVGYWGDIGHRDERIVEAADIALSVWLLRDQLWPALSDAERQHVARWLGQVNGKAVHDNNWHLFTVMVKVTIIQESAKTSATPPARDYGTVARMLDAMAAAYGLTRELGGPWRPMNRELGYSAPRYSSSEPFCGCALPAR